MELTWNSRPLPPGVEPPVLEPASDGCSCCVAWPEAGRRRVWRVRQDRLLKLEE
ncbi:MAG TPA: hypothetical protein VN765_00290 [Candidatus Acidoferrum sp.]|nr:hypothetical protein [Candidatus Acidoferrum sp.]